MEPQKKHHRDLFNRDSKFVHVMKDILSTMGDEGGSRSNEVGLVSDAVKDVAARDREEGIIHGLPTQSNKNLLIRAMMLLLQEEYARIKKDDPLTKLRNDFNDTYGTFDFKR